MSWGEELYCPKVYLSVKTPLSMSFLTARLAVTIGRRDLEVG